MRRGHLSAVCLCHSADGPVIRRPAGGGRIRQYRDPAPAELQAHTERRLAFMDALVAQHGMTRVLSPDDLEAARAAELQLQVRNQITNLPVATIAETLGFEDVQHVARYFRAGKAMSPLAYRKTYGRYRAD